MPSRAVILQRMIPVCDILHRYFPVPQNENVYAEASAGVTSHTGILFKLPGAV